MVQPAPREPRNEHSSPGKTGGDQELWRYLGLGTQLAITVGLFVALGWWLDRSFGWSPWGVAASGIMGIVAAMYYFLKEVLR